MSKVTVIQVIYNTRRFIEPVFSAIFAQTYTDIRVVAVISGNDDGGKALLIEKFPQVEIIDPGYNIGFARGHNMIFDKYDSEYFQLVNPDLILEPDYIEKMVAAMDAEKQTGAATGKLYQISGNDFDLPRDVFNGQKILYQTLDTTGVVIYKSGSARDRGQHEIDTGQYDNMADVQAVSGAGSLYRKSALSAIKDSSQYFDEDFHSYWEDVDLSWRMSNAGWRNIFVPTAVGYHGRGAGSSKNGYRDVVGFIAHHKTLSPRIRQLNYKNHIFMYIKNSKWLYPQFFVREFCMVVYIILFEASTLLVIPNMLQTLSKIWKKRKTIQHH